MSDPVGKLELDVGRADGEPAVLLAVTSGSVRFVHALRLPDAERFRSVLDQIISELTAGAPAIG